MLVALRWERQARPRQARTLALRVISNPPAEDSSAPQSDRLFTYHRVQRTSLSAHVEDPASSHTAPLPAPPGGLQAWGGGQHAHEAGSTDLAAACRQSSPAPTLAPGGPAIPCPGLTALPPGPLGPPHRTRQHPGSRSRGPALPLTGGAYKGCPQGGAEQQGVTG